MSNQLLEGAASALLTLSSSVFSGAPKHQEPFAPRRGSLGVAFDRELGIPEYARREVRGVGSAARSAVHATRTPKPTPQPSNARAANLLLSQRPPSARPSPATPHTPARLDPPAPRPAHHTHSLHLHTTRRRGRRRPS